MRCAPLLPLFGLVVACAGSEVGSVSEELAQPGPWQIPANVLEVGETQEVTYTGAGPWRGRDGCSGGFTRGAQMLEDFLYEAWPEIEHIGGYACRTVNGDSSLMSVHSTGRAVDINLATFDGEADNDLGDEIGNWLILNAQAIGIQRIIWDRWNWHVGRTPRSDSYGGRHPHNNHLHVELSVAGGNMDTEWFGGPMELPERMPCGDALPPEGGIVDDEGPCFAAFGNDDYWRREEGRGEGAGFWWTNAFESEDPSNWARWEFHVSEAGRYQIEVDSIAGFAIHPEVRYGVRAGEMEEAIILDPRAGGWNGLGEYVLVPGERNWVAVYDNYGPVESDQRISVDAIRVTRLDGPVGPDAGVEDAGASDAGDVDGSVLVDAGATLDGATCDAAPRPPDGGGGCSVGLVGREGPVGALALLAAAFVFGWRRRTR